MEYGVGGQLRHDGRGGIGGYGTIQIMPADTEHHACLAGPIRLLETPDSKRSQALSPRDSKGLLERLQRPAGANARSAMSTTELSWSKSSYSSAQGDDCLEIAPTPTAWSAFIAYTTR